MLMQLLATEVKQAEERDSKQMLFTHSADWQGLEWRVRRASRGVYCTTEFTHGRWTSGYRPEPTGGLEVTVTLTNPRPQYRSTPVTKTSRMKPGWTVEALAARLRTLGRQVYAERTLVEARNQVHERLGGSYLFTPRQVAFIEEQHMHATSTATDGRGWGHTADYDHMSLDDCAFWLLWAESEGIPPAPKVVPLFSPEPLEIPDWF